MTAEGLATLRAELERLETVGRTEIADQIRTAREWGDLKENAEYHAAKEAQAHLETRILSLRAQTLSARIVELTEGDIVGLGSTVEVDDEDSGRRATYRLVAAHDAVPAEGLISLHAPMGAALRGLRAGEVAVVRTPRGERRLRVVTVA